MRPFSARHNRSLTLLSIERNDFREPGLLKLVDELYKNSKLQVCALYVCERALFVQAAITAVVAVVTAATAAAKAAMAIVNRCSSCDLLQLLRFAITASGCLSSVVLRSHSVTFGVECCGRTDRVLGSIHMLVDRVVAGVAFGPAAHNSEHCSGGGAGLHARSQSNPHEAWPHDP